MDILNVLFIISVIILLIAISTYPKWSNKKWYERTVEEKEGK